MSQIIGLIGAALILSNICNTPLIDENRIYLGEFQITAYEETGNACANGNYPTVGYTIACNSLDFGTRVYIEGVGERVVEDRGGSHGDNWIDLYLGDVSACYEWGIQYCDVWLIEE